MRTTRRPLQPARRIPSCFIETLLLSKLLNSVGMMAKPHEVLLPVGAANACNLVFRKPPCGLDQLLRVLSPGKNVAIVPLRLADEILELGESALAELQRGDPYTHGL